MSDGMKVFMDWILATPASELMTTNPWSWPIAETIHFIGLALMAGTVGAFDLRMLGVAKGIAPRALHRLLPWGIGGFALSVITGLLFISGAPDQYFYNSSFHFKVVGLTAIGINAVLFYSTQYRAVKDLGPDDDARPAAQVMAAISLLLLVAVMLFGRMLTFFRPAGFY